MAQNSMTNPQPTDASTHTSINALPLSQNEADDLSKNVFSKKLQNKQGKNKGGMKAYGRAAAFLRSKSAPSRPLTEMEAFRKTKEFYILESTTLSLLELLINIEGKIDFDSTEGNIRGRNLLRRIEDLALAMNVKPADRSYRDVFSHPYKALYVGGQLCYLTEILDSAQERLPFIIVNSEKYIFSTNVLITGDKLYSSFLKLKDFLREAYYT